MYIKEKLIYGAALVDVYYKCLINDPYGFGV